MPIRFRCPHCHQLLGIARRKSGTMVHCPTCNTSVLVPTADEVMDAPAPAPVELEQPSPAPLPHPLAPPPAPPPPPGLFERDDFDALLRASSGGEPRNSAPGYVHPSVPARPAMPEPVAAPPPLPEPLPLEPWQAPGPIITPLSPAVTPPVGLVLSPARATVLTVVVILLLAIAFGAGLIVGRFYLG